MNTYREGSGCAMLLANDKYEDLSRMYRLFQRVQNGLPPMARIVQQHIEKRGNEIVNQREARINVRSALNVCVCV